MGVGTTGTIGKLWLCHWTQDGRATWCSSNEPDLARVQRLCTFWCEIDARVMCPSLYILVFIECIGFGLHPMPLCNGCEMDAPLFHLYICGASIVCLLLEIWFGLHLVSLHIRHKINTPHLFICRTSSLWLCFTRFGLWTWDRCAMCPSLICGASSALDASQTFE